MSINYTLYSHMANDVNWNIESYEVIKHITTLNELVSIIEYIPDELLTNCMFFFMKDNIKPMWEDEMNKNGGCISYKIPNNDCYKLWKDIIYSYVSSKITNSENINGLSISPKRNFCIIKIWLKVCDNIDTTTINNDLDIKNIEVIVKKHV